MAGDMIEGGTGGLDNLPGSLTSCNQCVWGVGQRSDQVPRGTPMGPLRTCERGPRLRIAESDAHALLRGRARPGQAACLLMPN